MPNIPQFENTIDSINPGDMGAGAVAHAGEYADATNKQIGSVFDSVLTDAGGILKAHKAKADAATTLNEFTAGAASWATKMDQLTQAWDAAPVHDEATRQKFLAQYDTLAESERGNYTTPEGQKHFEETVASSRNNVFAYTAADTANASATKTVTDLQTTVNTNAQMLTRNPEALDTVMKQADATVEGVIKHGGLDAKNADKMRSEDLVQWKKEYVTAAMAGQIARTGVGWTSSGADTFLKNFEKDTGPNGKWGKYAGIVGPDAFASAKKAAESQIRLNAEKASAASTAQAKADKEAINQTVTKILSDAIGSDGKPHVTPDTISAIQKVASMRGATEADVSAPYNFLKSLDAGTTAKVSDPATVKDFTTRAQAGTLKPTDIYQAGVGQDGKAALLTEHDVQMFIDWGKATTAEGKPSKYPMAGTIEGDLLKAAQELHPATPVAGNPFPTAAQVAAHQKYNSWLLGQLAAGLKIDGMTSERLLTPGTRGHPNPDYLPDKYNSWFPGHEGPMVYPAGLPAQPGAKPLPDSGAKPAQAVAPPPDQSPEGIKKGLDSIFGAPPGKQTLNDINGNVELASFVKDSLPASDPGAGDTPDATTPGAPAPIGAADGTISHPMGGLVIQAQSGIRALPVSAPLHNVLSTAALALDGGKVTVFSGGQHPKGSGYAHTGSDRHDNGNSADVHISDASGRTLDFNNPADRPAVIKFLDAAYNAGATGIGAGPGYMGSGIHVGFGNGGVKGGPLMVWGAGGHVANAPAWLVAWKNSKLGVKPTGAAVASSGGGRSDGAPDLGNGLDTNPDPLQKIVATADAIAPAPKEPLPKGAVDLQPLVTAIGAGEGPGGFNQRGGEKNGSPQYNLVSMPVSQVASLPVNRNVGSAVNGRYQIKDTTLRGLIKTMGLTGNEPFTPELQVKMAIQLMRQRGLDKYLDGTKSETWFLDQLSKEWASIPTSQGGSYYPGQGAKHTPEAILALLRALKKTTNA